jgi:hypothetical protein
MSKAKETIKEFRDKLFENKKKETIEQAQKTIEASLDDSVYAIVQDPNVKGRSFIMVKIKFNLESNQATIVGKCPFPDKAAGLSIIMQLENHKYLFEKNNRRSK